MGIMKRNIVLIGMPGCGKTTIGKILSERLSVGFFDVDKYIEEKSGKSIPELFKIGESHFRNIERQAIKELSRMGSSVISTGGGVIKDPINMQVLKTNGVIFFIDRPIEELVKDVKISTRPLLKDGSSKLYELLQERYELYKSYCDYHVTNKGTLEEVVEKIMEMIE